MGERQNKLKYCSWFFALSSEGVNCQRSKAWLIMRILSTSSCECFLMPKSPPNKHLCHSIALALLHTFLLFLFASLPESFSFLRSPSKHHWPPLQRLIHWLWLVGFFALSLDWGFYVFKWQNLNIAFCRNFLIKGMKCWAKVYHWKSSLNRVKALIHQSFTVSEKLMVDMIMCWYITHERKLS